MCMFVIYFRLTFKMLPQQKKLSETFKRNKPGQTRCGNCGIYYNNACVPPYCECGFHLKGKYLPMETDNKLVHQAELLTNDLVSVRLNTTGINVRIFESLAENKVVLKGADTAIKGNLE